MDYPDITTRPGAIAFILAAATEGVQDSELKQAVAGYVAVMTALGTIGISNDELGAAIETLKEVIYGT
jgi:hypothetical protein